MDTEIFKRSLNTPNFNLLKEMELELKIDELNKIVRNLKEETASLTTELE